MCIKTHSHNILSKQQKISYLDISFSGKKIPINVIISQNFLMLYVRSINAYPKGIITLMKYQTPVIICIGAYNVY